MTKLEELDICISHIEEMIKTLNNSSYNNMLKNILVMVKRLREKAKTDPNLTKIPKIALLKVNEALETTEDLYKKYCTN